MSDKITKSEAFEKLNESIMEIAKTYSYWHDKEWDYGVDNTLRRAEVHTIQGIGNNEGINLTELAAKLEVTKPTVSEKINKLIKYGLVEKQVSSKNNKEVMMFLTKKGRVAYESHEEKHRKMYELFMEHFGEDNSAFIDEFKEKLEQFILFLNSVKDKFS